MLNNDRQITYIFDRSFAHAKAKIRSSNISGLILQVTGMTPLMYAVKDNRTSYLDRLIDLGSDVGARNNVSFDI